MASSGGRRLRVGAVRAGIGEHRLDSVRLLSVRSCGPSGAAGAREGFAATERSRRLCPVAFSTGTFGFQVGGKPRGFDANAHRIGGQ
ncbi:hypothetical protein OPAG_02876 [Rhodococcus opacus PD630]|nr:hypothetical protein Pd630_LPD01170 [Rhodococcus opacus PD630]EHI44534.1 hypothetical protein OPAG_02876 [Rhodococcus opacus PD630]